jgi:hypothetical protein
MNEKVHELINRAHTVVDYLDVDDINILDFLDALASSGFTLAIADDDTASTAMVQVLMGE